MKKGLNNYLLLIDVFMIFTIYLFVESLTRQFTFVMVTNVSLLVLFLVITIGKIIINHFFKLYKRIWTHASIEDFVYLAYSFIVSNAILFILIVTDLINFTLLKLMAVMLLEAGGYIFTRFGFRYIEYFKSQRIKGLRNALIIGAGAAGDLVFREISRSPISYNIRVKAFIDDDLGKVGKNFKNVPVVGPFKEVATWVETLEIEEVIIAIPSLSRTNLAEMIDTLVGLNVNLRTLPSLTEVSDVKDLKIRDVSIEDLLGRDEITLDDSGIEEFIKGKTVLVTGGGGSIGSELIRQVLAYKAKKAVVFDIYENNAYDLEQELILKGYKNIEVLIGSVRDMKRLNDVFDQVQPDLVFHAAAHKHVPLMEGSPAEAIKNNSMGTYNVARTAAKKNVPDFVLISTDKAVNPTNIMGASKRLAEMAIQSMKGTNTKFSAVRFGNVLGSNGSVIPLFKKQIEKGGPVTVTHKDIIRYFMTIPEAVQLVIQSACFAQGGEIFVLDMGEPVRIKELAENMIRLSGLKVDEDIEIVYTGLRPGEKMFEELLLDKNQKKTTNERIFIENANGLNVDIDALFDEVSEDYKKIFDVIR